MGEAIAFYALAALILGFAVAVVSVQTTVYSVVFLVANFLCVAALYVLLHAEFLAVIQVLVYAGGIVVLYLFVVMLVTATRSEGSVDPRRRDGIGLLLAGLVLGEFVAIGVYSYSGVALSPAAATPDATPNINAIGRLLYVDYLVPFEVASILLLVAMIGAIVLARQET